MITVSDLSGSLQAVVQAAIPVAETRDVALGKATEAAIVDVREACMRAGQEYRLVREVHEGVVEQIVHFGCGHGAAS